MAGRMCPARLSMADAAWPSFILFPTRATRRHVSRPGSGQEAWDAEPCLALARWLQLRMSLHVIACHRMRLFLQDSPSFRPIASWLVQAHRSAAVKPVKPVMDQMFDCHRLVLLRVRVPRETLSTRLSIQQSAVSGEAVSQSVRRESIRGW